MKPISLKDSFTLCTFKKHFKGIKEKNWSEMLQQIIAGENLKLPLLLPPLLSTGSSHDCWALTYVIFGICSNE